MAERSYIRASEVGEWLFCSVAWKLRREGAPAGPQSVIQQEAGREFHREHGCQVARARAAETAVPWLLGAAIAAAVLVFMIAMFKG